MLHASRLRAVGTEGQIAVIFEEARPADIAPLIVDAYGLTKREGEITHHAQHRAGSLQGHLRQVGMRSRRELVGQVFAQQYQARIVVGHSLDVDGWFA